MSTKIYNAYKINNMTIEEVMVKLRVIKERYHEFAVDLISKTDLDRYCDGEKNLMNTLKEETKNGQGYLFDFTSSIVLYFHEGNIYLQHFGFGYPYTLDLDDYFDLGVAVDYHYQNQSDPWYDYEADKFTEDEYAAHEVDYEERERVWEEILGDSGVPTDCGLVFEVFQTSDCFKIVHKYHQGKYKQK